MSDALKQCTNCSFLHDQSVELRKEIGILHSRIDDLTRLMLRETKELATQTSMLAMSSVHTQTDDLNVSVSQSQTDALFSLFLNSVNSNTLAQQLANDSTRHVAHGDATSSEDPCLFCPDKPFKSFSLEQLDSDTTYSVTRGNRYLDMFI